MMSCENSWFDSSSFSINTVFFSINTSLNAVSATHKKIIFVARELKLLYSINMNRR